MNGAGTGSGSSATAGSYDSSGGLGVGGRPGNRTDDVPHFNWGAKYQQHQSHQNRQRRAAWMASMGLTAETTDQGVGFWLRAAAVGVCVLFAGAMGGVVRGGFSRSHDNPRKS